MSKVKTCDICCKVVYRPFLMNSSWTECKIRYGSFFEKKLDVCESCMEKFKKFVSENENKSEVSE